jgi:hypothetical protein
MQYFERSTGISPPRYCGSTCRYPLIMYGTLRYTSRAHFGLRLLFHVISYEINYTGFNGTMDSADWVALANVDGQRVRLPPDFAKLAGVSEVSPESPIDCWLLVLKQGRFQLQRKLSPTPTIAEILRHLESLATVDSDSESDEEIAIRARLFSCVVTWHQRGPRINLPKEIFYLAPGERSHVYFLKVAGHIEIWFPDILRRAVSVPISGALS